MKRAHLEKIDRRRERLLAVLVELGQPRLVGALADLLEPGSGEFFPGYSPRHLAEDVERLLDDVADLLSEVAAPA